MSRAPEEVSRLTESTYKNVMEQFNPGLRNLINLGKNYEKAVNAMILAGRAYYDGLAKIGDIATESPVSKELGQVLVEISSAHKKLNDSLDESFKKFHKEIITELEKKTELDVKYMNATLKRYQTEHKSRLDSLEKSQAELKKIKRKSQGGRNAMKYEYKEIEYLETVTSRQSDIQRFIAEGCREALLEEKRRFCFLVDKHCSFTQHMNYYHIQCTDLLNSKLPVWQETCSDATKVPEKVISMIEEIKTPGSTPISGTPQPSPMIERNTVIGKNYYPLHENAAKVPPAPTSRAYISPLVDMFNNPAAVQKAPSERLNNSTDNSDDANLCRSTSVATGLNIMKRPKVKTIFPHTAGSNKTLLSFAQGDIITLLVAEEKDGWLYGEHDLTKVKGWFPSSYTKPLEEPAENRLAAPVPSPVPIRSISSVNLADKGGVVLPPPDYLGPLKIGAVSEKRLDSSKDTIVKVPVERPDSTTPKPDINGITKPPFLSGENPFATVKLRPTVTNDRSAPIIR
ncbi:PREDICTED: brain-specific angiogenesis inhibitor 1-associated protein 2-like protein 1 isoform X1 [Gavialis gangeticus]|uniref:brain-specific angiogenesis inhibitor 1-associated protein 2-like protein 1 isoform X1 n=1 Tax=Gavialis gangeticus TaxID=94835 RepID=UPI00092F01C8|nr:PREDICTED: brain-specific angiogenesis inhibitor 1-associated protein 2-like protein 1 isoform X1 [Gavialis gangeticus]